MDLSEGEERERDQEGKWGGGGGWLWRAAITNFNNVNLNEQ